MKLLKYKWYRSLFSTRTFVLVDGKWMDYKNYKEGKITDVDGAWRHKAFCLCGNELVYSKSLVGERHLVHWSVLDYKCANCGNVQHWNPSFGLGLVFCNKDGHPIKHGKTEWKI